MQLSTHLSPEQIKLNLEARSKEEVFEEMVHLLVESGKLPDRDEALQALWDRESKMTTGIGNGLAIPHGKVAAKIGLVIGIGISHMGIEFDALDGELVYVVIMVFSEEEQSGPHIQALAEIARLFTIPGFLEKIRNVKKADEVIKLIREQE